MILTDNQIALLAADGMISPFAPQQVRQVSGVLVVSFGLSCVGYDFSVSGEEMYTFDKGLADPKKFDRELLDPLELHTDEDTGEQFYVIEPGAFALGFSVEYFKMPTDLVGLLTNKSTIARCGVDVRPVSIEGGIYTMTTVLEPGWEGNITAEFANLNKHTSVKVYASKRGGTIEGGGQIVFFRTSELPAYTYDKRVNGPGKYQGQTGVTLPKV